MIYKKEELSNQEYRRLPQYSGSEIVKAWKECPAALLKESKHTPALIEGVLVHLAVLEPDELDMFDECSSAGEFSEILEKNLGIKYERKINNWQEMLEKHQEMKQVLIKSKSIKSILESMITEVSVVGDDIKCRIDILTSDYIIADYKTTISAHPVDFARDAKSRGYLLKMAMQRDLLESEIGIKVKEVCLIAQEKVYPYLCAKYTLSDDALNFGRRQYQIVLEKIKKSERKKENLEGYTDQTLSFWGIDN